MKKIISYISIYLLLIGLCNAQVTTTPTSIGIGVPVPEFNLDVKGDIFVNSSAGSYNLGFINNGNRWRWTTTGLGANILYQSKLQDSNSWFSRMVHFQNGDLLVGGASSTSKARLELLKNSESTSPHLMLTEEANDYSRISFENTSYSGRRWRLEGYPNPTSSLSKFNFSFDNIGGNTDVMTLLGNGRVGINTNSPTSRLEIAQASQQVGTGLRFNDGTLNGDWDITHGYALRFHYDGILKGYINAETGAYVQSSDERLKKNFSQLNNVLSTISKLKPMSYQYSSNKTGEKTFGFLAQDVQSLFPELVYYSEVDDIYGINYTGFSTVAIKGIQELSLLMQEKDKKIESLEARIERLEKLLNR